MNNSFSSDTICALSTAQGMGAIAVIRVSGKQALEIARDVMKFYSQRFGPYPYGEFSIAPVHLGYGGEQMSNMIFIDTRVFELPKILDRYFDFLISHEMIAHIKQHN